jgi:hypothetical protein
MTPKERVAAVFAGEKPDRVPVHHIGISSHVASKLLGHEAYVGGGIQQWREATALWNGPDAHAEYLERSYQDAIAVSQVFGNDVVRASYWRHDTKPTRKLDENTYLFEYGDESQWQILRFDPPTEQCEIAAYLPERELSFEYLDRALRDEEQSIADWRPSPPKFETRALRELGDEYAIRCGGASLGISLERHSIWFEAILLRPDLVARSLDLQVEYACRRVPVLAAAGFRYLFGGGDFASNEGPMYSPKAFHELMLPRLKQITDICHEHRCFSLFASDGDLWPVADDLFGASGVDGYYEIDRRAGMHLRELHARFPRLLTIGNISSHTVHLGTKEDIRREVEEAIAAGKEHGRTIVGISNAIVPGTPIDNVVAMMEAVQELR